MIREARDMGMGCMKVLMIKTYSFQVLLNECRVRTGHGRGFRNECRRIPFENYFIKSIDSKISG